jgi:hypothetical protein
MHGFLLNLAGIDQTILRSTRNETSKGFVLCGAIALLFFLLNFLSTAYLLSYLVDNIWLDLLIAAAYATVVFNFYRFTLSSIIWRSKDFKKLEEVKPPSMISTVMRCVACGFFVIIMSKPIELFFFHTAVFRAVGTSGKLYENFAILHEQFFITWLITLTFLSIFLWPIYYRSLSSRWGNKEYERSHFVFLMTYVQQQYELFKDHYNATLKDLKIKSEYRTQYGNAPFNTELKAITVNTQNKKLEEHNNRELCDLFETLPIN